MIKTEWKPAAEIKYALGSADTVSIISCAACANLCDNGGSLGIRILRDLLRRWDKEVVFSTCVTACCSEEIMRQALRTHRRPLSKSDAMIVLSCASGIKSAYLCEPEIPVVAVLDTVGVTPISHQDNPIVNSHCSTCDHCVIAYTGGICPVTECPAKKKYEPCKDFPERGTQCALNPLVDCVWKEIEKRGELSALKKLEEIHKTEEGKRLIPDIKGTESPPFLRKIAGRIAASPGVFEKMIRFIH
ncbi:MAG: methylenetetrahydrofolate reductase C-terminal domain-containing protein [Deltaproteobacteria bacterium]|nr:methylenetetrahydrofolate reductase C-terminal domain-containing protein [Deltaproteobacteria bacterium]MBN2687089.1 methylenetetrahydrofolate reductase C-terminal domain-containing protein [Deltaproteobacteria bacterium]